jgi:hypothetical protein
MINRGSIAAKTEERTGCHRAINAEVTIYKRRRFPATQERCGHRHFSSRWTDKGNLSRTELRQIGMIPRHSFKAERCRYSAV